ncbi:MAG: four helix bundle protein [Sphingobacteriales bacterium]|nr:MAG: four helix bundle protein [Sphingobacteriales bacterium]
MMQITELEVWKASMDMAKSFYELSRTFPELEDNGLGMMMRKAVTSLPSNIAAAASRKYGAESLRYLFKAKGYIYEVETHLYLAQRLGYISEEQMHENLEMVDTSRKLLFGFIKYYKRTAQPQ